MYNGRSNIREGYIAQYLEMKDEENTYCGALSQGRLAQCTWGTGQPVFCIFPVLSGRRPHG